MGGERLISVPKPRSLLIAVSLQTLQGLGLIAIGFYELIANDWLLRARVSELRRIIPFALIDEACIAVIAIGVGAALLLSALAIWRLSPLAWTVAVALHGLNLLMALIEYVRYQPDYLAMLMSIAIVLYLNQYEVITALGMRWTERSP